MTNGWSKQAYGQGYYLETITIKNAVNMFGYMETVETIYEGVAEPSYKKY